MDKELIEQKLNEKLQEMNLFLVELNVTPDNIVTVFADGIENITIDQCTAVARYLRSELGEDGDHLEITVSSPGLDKPFRHPNQYLKSIGKSVEVLTVEGKKIEGKIDRADEKEVVINIFKKRNPKNKAQKLEVSNELISVNMNDIKQTKKLITI